MKTLPIFVYGTLKRGERNQSIWPDRNPIVRIATLENASLYDYGPYPCMVDGDEIVGGELWAVRKQWYPATIEALDRLEGYQPDGDSLYIRRVVSCQTATGNIEAYAYFFNLPLTDEYQKLAPDENGIVSWNGK